MRNVDYVVKEFDKEVLKNAKLVIGGKLNIPDRVFMVLMLLTGTLLSYLWCFIVSEPVLYLIVLGVTEIYYIVLALVFGNYVAFKSLSHADYKTRQIEFKKWLSSKGFKLGGNKVLYLLEESTVSVTNSSYTYFKFFKKAAFVLIPTVYVTATIIGTAIIDKVDILKLIMLHIYDIIKFSSLVVIVPVVLLSIFYTIIEVLTNRKHYVMCEFNNMLRDLISLEHAD